MGSTIKLSRAGELGVAIRIMAGRMVGTEQEIQRGMAVGGGAFIDSPAYRRLSNRLGYQERALARLVFALTDLAKVEQVRSLAEQWIADPEPHLGIWFDDAGRQVLAALDGTE